VNDITVSHFGTLNGTASLRLQPIATITQLAQDNGAVYGQTEGLFIELAASIRALFNDHRMAGVVNQIGPVFHMMFIDALEVNDFDTFNKRDSAKYTRFAELMLGEGVLLRRGDAVPLRTS